MHPNDPTFDRSDLILAWLSKRKYCNAHEDLRSYHDAVGAAFKLAFGIDLDVPPEGIPFSDEDGVHGLFLKVARSYEAVTSPFSSYLGGSRAISEIYQKYGTPLNEAVMSMRKLHLVMLAELAGRIWGKDIQQRLSHEQLESCGHPGWNPPDLIDYW